MRSKKGFTLIELMIVVAIMGVLAAIAVPAYLDYTRRARMSEVINAFAAIATGVTEYHSVTGYFPDESYTSANLAYFSDYYGDIVLNNLSDSYTNISIVGNFKSTLNVETSFDDDYGKLTMRVTYGTTGYIKDWMIGSPHTTIDAIYIPRQ